MERELKKLKEGKEFVWKWDAKIDAHEYKWKEV